MEISASGSLSDGKYEKGSFSEVQVINGFTGAPPSNCGPGSSATQIVCSVDLSGLPLIQLPKKQFNISATQTRSEEHTSELQSLMRISYAVFCLKKKKNNIHIVSHES